MKLLKLSGADAETFLQRQSSNSIKDNYVAFLDPKAKIIALAFAKNTELFCADETVEKLKSHLEKFAIVEEVEFSIEDTDSEYELETFNEGDTLIKLDLLDKYVDFSKGCFPGQEVLSKYKNIGLKKKSERAEKYSDEALQFFAKGDEERAIELLQKALGEDPKHETSLETLGVIYGRQNKFTEAIEVMKRLEKVNPQNIMAKTNLSIFYMKIGDKETAEQYKAEGTVLQFEKALAKD